MAASPKISSSQDAIKYIIDNFEGTRYQPDDVGKGPSRFGLNFKDDGKLIYERMGKTGSDQALLQKMDELTAIDIYDEKYKTGIKTPDGKGFQGLPDNMKLMVLDTAINFGVGRANEFLKITSDDPQKYAQLRRSKHESIVNAHRHDGKLSKTWQSVEIAWQHRDAQVASLSGATIQDTSIASNPAASKALTDLATNVKPKEVLDNNLDVDNSSGLSGIVKILLALIGSLLGNSTTNAISSDNQHTNTPDNNTQISNVPLPPSFETGNGGSYTDGNGVSNPSGFANTSLMLPEGKYTYADNGNIVQVKDLNKDPAGSNIILTYKIKGEHTPTLEAEKAYEAHFHINRSEIAATVDKQRAGTDAWVQGLRDTLQHHGVKHNPNVSIGNHGLASGKQSHTQTRIS